MCRGEKKISSALTLTPELNPTRFLQGEITCSVPMLCQLSSYPIICPIPDPDPNPDTFPYSHVMALTLTLTLSPRSKGIGKCSTRDLH